MPPLVMRVAHLISSIILLAIAGMASLAMADTQAPTTRPAAAAKTGELATSFADRSPDSSTTSLARRFGMKQEETAGDYNLKDKQFVCYVPSNYDPASPPGIVFFADSLNAVPAEFEPALDAAHLILIAPKNWGDAP
jgi:hypothetical protein